MVTISDSGAGPKRSAPACFSYYLSANIKYSLPLSFRGFISSKMAEIQLVPPHPDLVPPVLHYQGLVTSSILEYRRVLWKRS